MKNLIQNKIQSDIINLLVLSKLCYSISEKYFYIILCHLHKEYKNNNGFFLGHDNVTKNGIPSFKSFGISQRICKSARKKLKDGGLIVFRHVYGEKGHRIGTEYDLCDLVIGENPKEVHARILNKRSLELSTPVGISPK